MLHDACLPLIVIAKVRSWCRVAEIEEWTIKRGGCINADCSSRTYGSGANLLLAAACDEAEDCKIQHVRLHVVQEVSTDFPCGYKSIKANLHRRTSRNDPRSVNAAHCWGRLFLSGVG